MDLNKYRLLFIIGTIEILIGSSTLFLNFILILAGLNAKTQNVLFFVTIAGSISTLIGIGILKFNRLAYDLLIYFSSVIIISKVLIVSQIIQVNGQLEVTIHEIFNIPLTDSFRIFMTNFKNYASAGYHAFLICYLKRRDIKNIFHP